MQTRKFIAAAISMALISGAAGAQTIAFGTTKTGGANNNLATALAKIVTEKTGLKVRIIPMTGLETYGPMTDRGRMDLVTANATDLGWAMTGTGPFKGKKMANLRLVAALYSFHVGFFVRKDSPIKTVADVKGKRVPIKFSNQYSAGRHAYGVLWAAGLKEKDLDGVPVPNVVRAAADFARGKLEASFFAVGAGKVKEVAAQVGGIRYLPLPTSDDAVKRMREFVPFATVEVLKPTPSDPGIVGDLPVMTDVYYLVAGKHVKADVIAKFLDVLYSEKKKLTSAVRRWSRYNPKGMYRAIKDLAWHPAAVKWYETKGQARGNL